ncbi:hypothetical protein [Methanomethylovorans sp.]|uniref:hypothetical protein n=1 Tax=Methanomethylovorans sp. TaxID=2758717 RepID=UPI00345EE525
MINRHEKIGIKQVIKLEWMDKTANLLLTGLDEKSIRQEIREYLISQKKAGLKANQSEKTITFTVANLMTTWFSPGSELLEFRDDALDMLCAHPSETPATHWAMLCAVYPFWFNVALQIGRLLNLQNHVTVQQINNRLKEQYGDRQTVSRYALYVIRSFVAWGVLKSSNHKGCYERSTSLSIHDRDIAILLIEAILHAIPEGKGHLRMLTNSPALFPFRLPILTGDMISHRASRIDVTFYGLEDEFLKLREIKR